MTQSAPIKIIHARFHDRSDAGRQLAARLARRKFRSPLVLALPKGGVSVGYEIAKRLKAPLEVLLVRKLCHAKAHEAHFGALSECGTAVMNESVIQEHGLGLSDIDESLQEAAHTLQRRLMLFRPDHHLPPLSNRSVILADDFAVSGWSVLAALARIRREKPHELILALPVATREARLGLRERVDELVCLCSPEFWDGPKAWFEDAERGSDEEIYELLQRHGVTHPRAPKLKA